MKKQVFILSNPFSRIKEEHSYGKCFANKAFERGIKYLLLHSTLKNLPSSIELLREVKHLNKIKYLVHHLKPIK